MCVITISGGWFHGGMRFAECLARNLEFRCIDREVIVSKAAAGGVDPEQLREALLEPPSLFDRLLTHRKYLYLTLLQAALAEEVKDGRIVYHGYAGHLLLGGAKPVFRIRVIASQELRIRMAQERLDLDHDQALSYLHKVDVQRKKWTRYLYGIDWEDASLYDMVLNLGYLYGIEEACEFVTAMVRDHPCFAFTGEHRRALGDFALASRVRAALATTAPTANARVKDITASGGVLTVSGDYDDTDQMQEVERVARSVEGVRNVELQY